MEFYRCRHRSAVFSITACIKQCYTTSPRHGMLYEYSWPTLYSYSGIHVGTKTRPMAVIQELAALQRPIEGSSYLHRSVLAFDLQCMLSVHGALMCCSSSAAFTCSKRLQ